MFWNDIIITVDTIIMYNIWVCGVLEFESLAFVHI